MYYKIFFCLQIAIFFRCIIATITALCCRQKCFIINSRARGIHVHHSACALRPKYTKNVESYWSKHCYSALLVVNTTTGIYNVLFFFLRKKLDIFLVSSVLTNSWHSSSSFLALLSILLQMWLRLPLHMHVSCCKQPIKEGHQTCCLESPHTHTPPSTRYPLLSP